MKFWFLDYEDPENPIFETTDDENIIKMYLCVQEILMWRGECWNKASMGIDYNAIFNSSTYITQQLEDVLDKYRPYFRNINYNITQESQSVVIVSLDFSFYLDTAKSGIFTKQQRIKLTGDRRVNASA